MKFTKEDQKRINSLREYFRKNFKAGESDDRFIDWIEGYFMEDENELEK